MFGLPPASWKEASLFLWTAWHDAPHFHWNDCWEARSSRDFCRPALLYMPVISRKMRLPLYDCVKCSHWLHNKTTIYIYDCVSLWAALFANLCLHLQELYGAILFYFYSSVFHFVYEEAFDDVCLGCHGKYFVKKQVHVSLNFPPKTLIPLIIPLQKKKILNHISVLRQAYSAW